jgi:hypothetical protein
VKPNICVNSGSSAMRHSRDVAVVCQDILARRLQAGGIVLPIPNTIAVLIGVNRLEVDAELHQKGTKSGPTR